jgi:tRNA pseudouridine55 synthase
MQLNNNGILIVDKPAGTTSADLVARVKKQVGAKKVGHTGTLDPFATGVIVCCINRATKLARFFLHGNKKYDAVLHLGIETDTQDFTGTVISTSDEVEFSEITVRSAFKQFEGIIDQHPPAYSALKYNGVPLYKLARRGKPIRKPARPVYISNITIIEINLPLIRFVVSCSGGTYIRTLCSDIGASLGCGGHLKELRRIESNGFSIHDAITLQELETLALTDQLSDHMISMADALKEIPGHVADKALVEKIMHGKTIKIKDLNTEHIDTKGDLVKILDADNKLVAVLEHPKDSHKFNYCCVFDN